MATKADLEKRIDLLELKVKFLTERIVDIETKNDFKEVEECTCAEVSEEEKRFKKIIELLEDFDWNKLGVEYMPWVWLVSDNRYWIDIVTSNSYWFIEWLIDKDKIETDFIDDEMIFDDYHRICSDEYSIDICALLQKSKHPIKDLVSIVFYHNEY